MPCIATHGSASEQSAQTLSQPEQKFTEVPTPNSILAVVSKPGGDSWLPHWLYSPTPAFCWCIGLKDIQANLSQITSFKQAYNLDIVN